MCKIFIFRSNTSRLGTRWIHCWSQISWTYRNNSSFRGNMGDHCPQPGPSVADQVSQPKGIAWNSILTGSRWWGFWGFASEVENGKGAGQKARRAGSILLLWPNGLNTWVGSMLLQVSNFSFPFLPSAPSPSDTFSSRMWLLPLASPVSTVSDSPCFFSHGLDINISVIQSNIVF